MTLVPRPHAGAVRGLDHLRHRLRPGVVAGRAADHTGPSHLDGRPERQHLSRVRRDQGLGHQRPFTYPDQANDPYGGGRQKNVWRVDRDSVLLGTAGHLHPGGLHDRPGATGAPGSSVVAGKPDTAHLFRSVADYFEPAGAVSWDVSMTATPPNWRVQVHEGDMLRINTTYDSKRASWYESMGVMIVWATDGTNGRDPFATKVDTKGELRTVTCPRTTTTAGRR